MPPTNLEKAEAERGSLKLTITLLQGQVAGIVDVIDADSVLEDAKQAKVKLSEIHDRILACAPADVDVHHGEYGGILVNVNTLIKDVSRKKLSFAATGSGPTVSSSADIRLPRIDLPHFNGNLSDWMSFRDLYTAAIHTNVNLSGARKLTYLKSCLVGEASQILKSIPPTDADYDGAWKQLTKRFENVRELSFAILKKFMSQANVHPDSASGIRTLVDGTRECMREMENLGVLVENWDVLIVYLVAQKLDSASRQAWELSLTNTSLPKLDDFLEFLEARVRGLTAGGSSNTKSKPVHDSGKKVAFALHTTGAKNKCKFCNGDHGHHRCSKFQTMSASQRKETAWKHRLCFNCLRVGHGQIDCSSDNACQKCNGRHHSLLHEAKSETHREGTSVTLGLHSTGDKVMTNSMLATAILKMTDRTGQLQTCRALLDGGSTSSFISETCVKRLGLRREKNSVDVIGLGSTSVGTARGVVSIRFFSHMDDQQSRPHSVTALILSKVTGKLPVYKTACGSWHHLESLQLADPSFNEPNEVDVLLGADIFYELLLDGRRRGPPGTPVGLRSTLGWLVAGSLGQQSVSHVRANFADVDLDRTLQQFWQLESVPDNFRIKTKEEKICEAHFQQSTTRNPDGRYVVKLPFKEARVDLAPSRDTAIRRLIQLERRLAKNPAHYTEYRKFMTEYEALGHMKQVRPEDHGQRYPGKFRSKPRAAGAGSEVSGSVYYIPHHLVVKESSTTTKFRAVFNASSKTSSGYSLNDCLHVGPTLQDSLVSILMRFRIHVVAFTADLVKMYRQILMSPEHTSYQRIVWRDSEHEPIKDYELLTVTYGTTSGSYHATKVLQTLAEDEKDDLPLASQVASNDFYMDDCMSGAPNVDTALKTQGELRELMKRGGFDIRKWSSNRPEVLESLPEELRETQLPLKIELDETVKTLGLHWNPATDDFMFKVSMSSLDKPTTKRMLISEMSKLFDPIGWLAPVVIRAKVVAQQLWKLKVGWDDPLPAEVQDLWNAYRDNLHEIEQVRLSRCYVPENTKKIELFGFCDASEKAYAAVVYIRASLPDGKYHVSLCTSKTRVAPTKQVTLPRLELCGAVILSQLVSSVQSSLKIKIDGIYTFTDSMAVLAWLSSQPARWNTFVANRVAEVQEVIEPCQWKHVSGFENPADCASRGIDPAELHHHPLWWTGPAWMQNENPNSPSCELDITPPQVALDEERRVVLVGHTQIISSSSLLFRYSSLTTLKRITAWCKRFIRNCAAAVSSKKVPNPCSSTTSSVPDPYLNAAELDSALLFWVKLTQSDEFRLEISHLDQGQEMPNASRIRGLNPFLDSTQLLRVGGRLRHAPLTRDQRHPILLPRHHRLTELLIQHEHQRTLHGGAQLILSNLHRRYWIVGARDAIRHQIKKCLTCTRHAGRVGEQMMGDLPAARLTPARPFLKTGVDYAGPLILRAIPGRSKVTFKAYIALFICMTTRAIHLEAVTSLSTEAFLQAFRRFIGRRGLCTDVYSDCGTNFVGAARELDDLQSLVNSENHNQKVKIVMANEGVHWHFNPPGAPHMGGLWEAGVKSVKHHLFRTVGATRLTYEELSTVLIQIEACLNSRPLTPVSTDPTDLCVLTPGHFLIGDSLKSIPDADLTDCKLNRLARWQMVQQIHQQFWKRWSSEFLTRLQQRPKWLKCRTDIRVDDLILIKDENLPPLKWKLGRVIACHPGADTKVRVVTVRTADGEIKRPIAKLCLLPHDPSTKNEEQEPDHL